VTLAAAGTDTILRYGDPWLRQPCQSVRPADPAVRLLADRLWSTLRREGGWGLAAPQLGDLKRVVVIRDPRRREAARRLVLVNPTLTARAGGREVLAEGCLSFPGLYLNLPRNRHLEVHFWDLAGQEQSLEAHGLLARAIQHELDHLDGVLFIDHLSRWRRWSLFWQLRQISRS
jgi:peptide deformylase